MRTMARVLSAALMLSAVLALPPPGFDCGIRRLLLPYIAELQPGRSQAEFDAMAASLARASAVVPPNNGTACTLTAPRGGAVDVVAHRVRADVDADTTFYVSPAGNDAAPGTASAPFATIARAVAAARGLPGSRSVTLLGGTHFLNGTTVALTGADGGTSFVGAGGAVVSGGTPLTGLTWSRAPPSIAGGNAWSASLAAFPSLAGGVFGLRDARSDARLPRARFPNVANLDVDSILDTGLVPTAWAPHTNGKGPARVLYPPYPYRDDILLMQHYTVGIGGVCSHLSPPYAFWCSNLTSRETNGTGFLTYPSGVALPASLLPHLPYADVTGAVLHTWHSGRWFSAQFALDAARSTWDGARRQLNATFAAGGWQGARGYATGRDVSIENVMEELDAPGEWHFNVTTAVLTLYPPGPDGAPPPPDGALVALGASSKVLINVSGTPAAPVTNVSFACLRFTDAAYTYLDPHGLPSGGDWALARTGALFAEGVSGLRVVGCAFSRLDNNALFVSGFARGVVVANNTFEYLGESAVVLWGYAGGESDDAPGMGWDTRTGEQPRGVVVDGNLCHDIGIWQKQSACLFMAESASTSVTRNVWYDVPRAAINENDLGMGGHVVSRNAAWSVCRETADHGVWNSWSRTARVNDLRPDGSGGGTATTVPLWTSASGNLWIAQAFPRTKSGFAPGAQEAFDTDDGSAYLNVTGNVFVYGASDLKSDLGGHDCRHSGNALLFVGRGFGVGAVVAGHADHFINNTVVLLGDGAIGGGQNCGADDATRTVVARNRYVTPTGAATECGVPLAQWQRADPARNDPGSVAEAYPADLGAAAVRWAAVVLGLAAPEAEPTAVNGLT